ncbi:MAG TPA: aminotransferase class I/II-fold pyridoxal phosphate-dependent enzyme [Longimicrobium sp.]
MIAWNDESGAAATAAPPRELTYLEAVLRERAPGPRVLALGDGGAAALAPLAGAGFGVEPAGEEDGDAWPAEIFDAVVCLAWPAAAPEPAQRRLLRRIRHHLAECGVLVIGHTPATPRPSEGGDPAAVRRARLLELESRHSATAALLALVRLSGFAVERIDADFLVDYPATPASATLQLVARPLAAPPEALAVASWTTRPGMRLDLRYAPEEAGLLEPRPEAVWEALVRQAGRGGAGVVAGYPVDDPYGGVRAAPAVSRFFGVELAPEQLTFAAGVTSLLHDAARLADGGCVAAPALVHPDLEAWAVGHGSEVRLLDGPATLERLTAHLEEVRPALLHFDRPDFTGRFLALPEVEALARAAAAMGAAVVIDESPAPYLGPRGSAATLANRVGNLVVLRGFTKAYSLGGMRAAFAVASPGVSQRVRELVAPMQVGELALAAALRLLDAGDLFGGLRARVRAVKPGVVARLRWVGLEVMENHREFPWVAVADPGGAASRFLEARGIFALRPAPVPVFPEPRLEVLRLTVPLSDERLALFVELLTGPPREGEPSARDASSSPAPGGRP